MGNKKTFKKDPLKVVGYVAIAVLVFFGLICLSVFIQAQVNPDKIPSIFGYKPFIILSGSMEQELYKGDLAITKSVDTSTLKEGDVIAFRDKDNYVVTHRIVEIVKNGNKHGFVTKGDNNNSEDIDVIYPDKVEGKYLFKMAGLGNVVLVMQEPLTLGIILAIIAVGGVIWIMWGNSKLSKEERKELEKLREENNGKGEKKRK